MSYILPGVLCVLSAAGGWCEVGAAFPGAGLKDFKLLRKYEKDSL
jgi:hypothetical protein